MHPAPIKVTDAGQLPHNAIYVNTLASGERIYRTIDGTVYALQPNERK